MRDELRDLSIYPVAQDEGGRSDPYIRDADLPGELIYAYSRAQAVEDGALIDASVMAREAGFTVPVALTRAAWQSYVSVPEGADCQDEAGRLWDVLWMSRHALRCAPPGGNAVEVSLFCVVDSKRCDARTGKPCPPVRRRVRLHAVFAPGDEGEPVITIMLPGED